MRILFTTFILFLTEISFGQINSQESKRLAFENATVISYNVTPNYLNDNYLEVDDLNNKFNFNTFKGQIVFGNDTLQSTDIQSVSINQRGLYICQFDSSNIYKKSARIAYGDSVWSTAMRYFNQHFYVMISFNNKIITQNDTIYSKGGADVCILKYDKNFNLIKYVNIGNYNSEYIPKDAFKLANGHIYFASSINGGDTTNYVYENYKVIIGSDTVVCDTSYNCSKSEILLCKMDTNLQPVKLKVTGGSFENGCYSLEVQNESVYLIGSTTALVENNIGGIVFDYQGGLYYSDYHFIAKLNENFEGQWVRKFSVTSFAMLNIRKFYVCGNNIIMLGSSHQGSGCGGNSSNRLYIQNKGYFGDPLNQYGDFDFMISIDTLGSFRWGKIIDLYQIRSFNADKVSSKFRFCGDVYNASVIGDSINNCGYTNEYIGEIDLNNGSQKMIATLCGTVYDNINEITQSPSGKVYVVGHTKSDIITTENNECYPDLNKFNFFYASLDSFIIKQNPTNVNNTEKNSLIIFPNPSNGDFSIVSSILSIKDKFQIIDVTGKIVFESNLEIQYSNNHFRVKLPKLTSGIYYFKLQKEDTLYTSKIIID